MTAVSDLRSHRWWRVLAVMFLVPVVVFATPSTAAAAGGDWQKIYLQMDVLGSNDWVGRDCTFNARNDGEAVQIGSSGYCTGLPDSSPGTVQPGEAGSSFTFTFDGADAGGASCGATYGGTLGQHHLNGTIRVAGSVPAGAATITGGANDGTCTITEVCIRLMSTEYVCGEFTLEPPEVEDPVHVGSCKYGTATWANPRVEKTGESTYFYDWQVRVDVIVAGELPPGLKWTSTTWTDRTGVWKSALGTVDRFVGQATILFPDKLTKLKQDGPPTLGEYGQLGVQFAAPHTAEDGQNWNAPSGGGADNFSRIFAGAGTGPGYAIPPGRSDYYGGWTDPTHCRFWTGPKVLSVDGSDGDEPASNPNLPDEDPGPVDPGPEPPIADPEDVVENPFEMPDFSWLWAILDAVRRAIVAVKNAILGLVDAIVDGIKGLFVPDDTFFDRKVASVDDAMDGSTVDNYVQVFNDIAPTGSSGCAGPSVTVPFGSGTYTPLSACEGVMATASSIAKVVIGVGVAVTAFFACLRILGSGFGWNPTPSGGVQ